MTKAIRGRNRYPGKLDEVYAGTPPGAIANLQLWFDAMTIINKNTGDTITQWDDLSGNARHLDLTGGGGGFLFMENGLNGLPCCYTGGGGRWMRCTAFSFTNITVFLVFRPLNPEDDNRGILSLAKNGTADWNSEDSIVIAQQDIVYQTTSAIRALGANNLDVKINNPTGSFPFLYTFRIENTGAVGTAYSHYNGGADVSDGFSDLNSIDPDYFFVNTRANPANNQGRADFGEIVVYDALLSSAQILGVEQYLMNKWRII